MIEEHVKFIAPVHVMPGENELESLSLGALRILRGEETAQHIRRSRSCKRGFIRINKESFFTFPTIRKKPRSLSDCGASLLKGRISILLFFRNCSSKGVQ